MRAQSSRALDGHHDGVCAHIQINIACAACVCATSSRSAEAAAEYLNFMQYARVSSVRQPFTDKTSNVHGRNNNTPVIFHARALVRSDCACLCVSALTPSAQIHICYIYVDSMTAVQARALFVRIFKRFASCMYALCCLIPILHRFKRIRVWRGRAAPTSA